MEALVLLGGFGAFAVFGFFVMAKLSTEAENGIPAPWAQVTCRWTWRP